MNERNVVIPNTDFNNKSNLVSLSLQVFGSGFILRENLSGEQFPIESFSTVATVLGNLGKEIIDAFQARISGKIEKGTIISITAQINVHKPGVLGAQPAGMIMIDMPSGPGGSFGSMMGYYGVLLGLTPDYMKQFTPDQDGWLKFRKTVLNNSDAGKGVAGYPNLFNPAFNGIFNIQPTEFKDIQDSTVKEEKDERSGRIKLD